jgi:glyoxylase-like metal-dependent hydrolase (beta-lactamase superfamily II)
MLLEPYHLLHPLLRRLPWPHGRSVEAVDLGPVRALRMARLWGGRELLSVHCFAAFDTLVDTGLACYAPEVLAFAREGRVTRAVVTHHHEDHVGAASHLVDHGIPAYGPERTAHLVRDSLPIRFYQHVLWGDAPPVELRPFEGAEVPLGPYLARVVPAPGHCADQVALHVPSEGWLFSGDAFLDERVKAFRRDEDFAATVATLERFLALDFDALYCAHRPHPKKGKEAVRRKLEWLREQEGRVRELAARGLDPGAIARRMPQARRAALMRALVLGDVSVENLVRSILHGPRPRREIEGREGAAAPDANAFHD